MLIFWRKGEQYAGKVMIEYQLPNDDKSDWDVTVVTKRA